MNSFFYRFKVAYKGTGYYGWQIQNGNKRKTVQGEIQEALKSLCNSTNVKVLGAGRTDAGVHALGQVFRAEIPISLPRTALIKGLNSLLAKNNEIKILEVAECDQSFRPIHDAFWKEYNYYFCTKDKPGPFLKDYLAYCPHDLNLFLMEEGCKAFVGTHDFCNFYCVGSEVSSTIRTIFHCEIVACESIQPWGLYGSPFYIIRVIGSGFLKQMVRLMVGSLWSLGQGKIEIEDLKKALTIKFPKKLGVVAPSEGLYLKEINYSSPYAEGAVIPSTLSALKN